MTVGANEVAVPDTRFWFPPPAPAPPPARAVAIRSNPARREILSARSASRVDVDVADAEDDWCVCRAYGCGWLW